MFHAPDGLMLAVEARGPGTAPPILFAHGFGQGRRMWSRTAGSLADRGWRTVTFDARGHGDSGRVAQGAYQLEQLVVDLLAVAGSLREPPVMVGHSMGGLLAMVAAGEVRPDPFRALVLVDITPRWEAAGVDRILGFMRAHLDGFDSLVEAASKVADYAPQRRRSAGELAQLLRRGDDGRWYWQWDPMLLETIALEADRHQQRLLDAVHHIDVPVLLVSGSCSDVVSERTVAEFLRNVPGAEHVQVPGATHAVAGDAHDAFTAAIGKFLDSLDAASPSSRENCNPDRHEAAGART